MFGLAIMACTYVGMAKTFMKMGREWWEAIVPFYSVYVLFDMLYGNGWKMFMMLIPFYNFYVMFKLYIDLAKEFGKSAGFGIGLVFLSPVFFMILGFDDKIQHVGSTAGDDEVVE